LQLKSLDSLDITTKLMVKNTLRDLYEDDKVLKERQKEKEKSMKNKELPAAAEVEEYMKLLKNAKIWLELAELGRKEAITIKKTFKELVQLIVQIKELEMTEKHKTSIQHFYSKDQDILTNLEIFLKNIARFAKVYSQKFGSIIGLILPANQMKCKTYDNIHKTMRNIKEKEVVATQVCEFLLKISMSKIPPVMIAALPTKGDMIAKEISDQLFKIIEMIASYDINLLSLGADNMNTEIKA
ncbi:177_t:CDS:2, partial [Funneliformis geosporum]